MSRAKVVLIMVCLAANVASAADTPTSQLHFKVIAGSVIVVPVMVNGRGPYDFVFDTGSESSMIDTALARELGIAALDRVVLHSPGGSGVLGRSLAAEIRLGPVRVLNSEVLIGPLGGLGSLSNKIHGIIGQTVLKHLDYVLDNAHSRIDFAPTSDDIASIRGVKRELRQSHIRPVLSATFPGSSQLNLVLDSGASNIVISARYRSLVWRCAESDCVSTMRTSLITQQTVAGRVAELDVAGRRFRDLQAALSNESPDEEEDGLLPTRLFSTIYFNNSEGYVLLGSAR